MKDGEKRNINRMRVLLLVPVFLAMLAAGAYPASVDDNYIKGYAASVLEREFHASPSSLTVKDGVIYLSAVELAGVDSGELVTALLKIKGVERVEILGAGQAAPKDISADTHRDEREKAEEGDDPYKEAGSTKDRLFDPLMADPRWPHFSMGYQTYTDDGEFGHVFAASFGETLPVYKWEGPFGGRWQVGVQAAGFIVHDLDTASWDLINEDYRGGVAMYYRREAWSGLFSIYHNSSHVGDEYLLHKHVDRVNFSYEAAQLKVSYDISRAYRVYAGIDYMFSPDPKDLKRWWTQYGAEFRCTQTYFNGLLRPMAAVDIKNRQENDWHSEISLAAGVKLESEDTLWNKINIMLEYYNGNSPNGQFHENYIEYVALATHFYF
ncbi:MAG: DUF1207 domain-containing protein [Nitrospirae bacterium]|nr:DUF1207 domain-containing protein [Nitrospirota bacterium]